MEHRLEQALQGLRNTLLFVLQMQGCGQVGPNTGTDPDFTLALQEAHAAGVHIMAMDCLALPDSLTLATTVPVVLT